MASAAVNGEPLGAHREGSFALAPVWSLRLRQVSCGTRVCGRASSERLDARPAVWPTSPVNPCAPVGPSGRACRAAGRFSCITSCTLCMSALFVLRALKSTCRDSTRAAAAVKAGACSASGAPSPRGARRTAHEELGKRPAYLRCLPTVFAPVPARRSVRAEGQSCERQAPARARPQGRPRAAPPGCRQEGVSGRNACQVKSGKRVVPPHARVAWRPGGQHRLVHACVCRRAQGPCVGGVTTRSVLPAGARAQHSTTGIHPRPRPPRLAPPRRGCTARRGSASPTLCAGFRIFKCWGQFVLDSLMNCSVLVHMKHE